MQKDITTDKRAIITEWVTVYSDDLFSWAYNKTHSQEVAEDLIQDTFLSACRGYEKFENKSSPKTWLFAILNNKIIDYYRQFSKIKSNTRTTSSLELPESSFDEYDNWKANGHEQAWTENSHLLDNPEFNEIMESCLSKLPNTWNTILSAKYTLQKNSEDICQEFSLSASNYWQIHHRAKILLKKCLEKNWFTKL